MARRDAASAAVAGRIFSAPVISATWRPASAAEIEPFGGLLHEANDYRQQLARAQSYAECEDLVPETGNDRRLPFHELTIRRLGHIRGLHHPAAKQFGRIHAGIFLKARPSRPRTQYAHADPGALQLVRQSLRKREDVGLAGVIHGHERTWLKSGGRGDVENPALTPFQHLRQKQFRQ